jgi:hypothetical protein
VIEVTKLIQCILILNGLNIKLQYSEEIVLRLGNIKFSVLVQQFISLALFIPILILGRTIFSGIESSKEFVTLLDQAKVFSKKVYSEKKLDESMEITN